MSRLRRACRYLCYSNVDLSFASSMRLLVLSMLAAASGCDGVIVSPGGGEGDSPAGETPPALVNAYAPARVRRLNFDEIQRSARDIFLANVASPSPLPASLTIPGEKVPHQFDTQYDRMTVSTAVAEALQQYAEWVAVNTAANLDSVLPCEWDTAEASCVRDFIETYGYRTWRRPLEAAEITMLEDLHATLRGAEGAGVELGIQGVVEALLQAPSFLFRTELGEASASGSEEPFVVLTPYETATAMAYFLWRSAPDDELLAAAEELATAEGRRKHARRMLEDPRTRASIRSFVTQWLEVDGLGDLLLSQEQYPEWDPSMNGALLQEIERFADTIVLSGKGYEGLLTAPSTIANQTIARLYGVEAASGTDWAPLELDPMQRSGVLTQPGFLASHSPPADFSPIFLGLFVRTKLLCQLIPEPADDIPQLPTDPTLTARERYSAHSADGGCQACHRMMDPVGFGFERFDALAQWRATDKAVALTGAGELLGTDADGSFTDPVGLGARLVSSTVARDCFVGQMYSYALGRGVAIPSSRLEVDEVAIAQAMEDFGSGLGDVRELMLTVVASDAFVRRDPSNLEAR